MSAPSQALFQVRLHVLHDILVVDELQAVVFVDLHLSLRTDHLADIFGGLLDFVYGSCDAAGILDDENRLLCS